MILYYPFTIFVTVPIMLGLVYALAKPSTPSALGENIIKHKEKYLILLGILLNIIFFVVIIGNNYLGGQHAVGNRYFYIYPAFLFLIGTINPKKLVPFLMIALLLVGPVISDPIKSSASPDVHTYKFPYQYAPIEYSQLNNLPFWDHSHAFDCALVYRIDDQSTYYKDGFLISDGTAEFLIRPRGDANDIGIFISSYQVSSQVSYSNHNETQLIETSNSTFLAFSDMTPVV